MKNLLSRKSNDGEKKINNLTAEIKTVTHDRVIWDADGKSDRIVPFLTTVWSHFDLLPFFFSSSLSMHSGTLCTLSTKQLYLDAKLSRSLIKNGNILS